MDRHPERRAEGRGRDEADAQSGVRAGAHTDDQVRHGPEPETGPGEDAVDCGQQQLAVPARVDLALGGEDGDTVVEGDGDGGRGGINGEQQHTNSLRLPHALRGRARHLSRSLGCC